MGHTECSIGHEVIKAPNGLLIVMRGVKNTVHSCTRQVAGRAVVAVRIVVQSQGVQLLYRKQFINYRASEID